MRTKPLQRFGTVGAVLALGALGGCASLWAPKHQAAAPSPQAVEATQTVSPGLVKQVQSSLQSAGYYKGGNVDGVWGERTRQAVEQYQKDHNLRVSGQLDAPTLQAMNIPSTSTDNQAANQTPPPSPNNPPPNNPPPVATNPPSGSTASAYTGPNSNR